MTFTAEGRTCLPRVYGAGVASLSGESSLIRWSSSPSDKILFQPNAGNIFFCLSFVLFFLKSLILGPTDSGGREERGNTQPQSSVPVCV